MAAIGFGALRACAALFFVLALQACGGGAREAAPALLPMAVSVDPKAPAFERARSDYSISKGPDGYRVTALAGTEGSRLVAGAERLVFKDLSVNLAVGETS